MTNVIKSQLLGLQKYIVPLAILAIVVYIIWKKGKNAGADTSNIQVKYPNGGKQIRVGFDANGLAMQLFDVMDGIFTWANTKEKVFILLNACTGEEMIAVYNAFNAKYGSKGKGTLTKWINDESNVVIGSVAPTLIQKLRSLGAV